MRSSLNILLLILGMTCYKSHAQMGAAAKVSWDVDVTFVVPVSQDSVWTLLKDYTLVSTLSKGYVQSIVDKDQTLPIPREVTLSNGQKREEILNQLEEQHKFLVYRTDKPSLAEGLSLVQIAVFTREQEGGHTELNWKALIEGEKEAKKQMMEQVAAEIAHYQEGWHDYFQKGAAKQMIRLQ